MIGSNLPLTRRVLIAIAVITGVMLFAFGGLAALNWLRFGSLGIVAAAVVCGVCWVSGSIPLSAALLFRDAQLFRDPQQAVQRLLLGMLFRMSLPLVVGLSLTQSHSELLKVGVMGMLVSVYLLGLFVETLLSWWIADSSAGALAPGVAKAS